MQRHIDYIIGRSDKIILFQYEVSVKQLKTENMISRYIEVKSSSLQHFLCILCVRLFLVYLSFVILICRLHVLFIKGGGKFIFSQGEFNHSSTHTQNDPY